jgi:hypothetical protein
VSREKKIGVEMKFGVWRSSFGEKKKVQKPKGEGKAQEGR